VHGRLRIQYPPKNLAFFLSEFFGPAYSRFTLSDWNGADMNSPEMAQAIQAQGKSFAESLRRQARDRALREEADTIDNSKSVPVPDLEVFCAVRPGQLE
jgi:hypothetical protein